MEITKIIDRLLIKIKQNDYLSSDKHNYRISSVYEIDLENNTFKMLNQDRFKKLSYFMDRIRSYVSTKNIIYYLKEDLKNYYQDAHIWWKPSLQGYNEIILKSILNDFKGESSKNAVYSYKGLEVNKVFRTDNYTNKKCLIVIQNVIKKSSGMPFSTHNYIGSNYAVKFNVNFYLIQNNNVYAQAAKASLRSWVSSKLLNSNNDFSFAISEFPNCCGLAAISDFSNNDRIFSQFSMLMAYKLSTKAGFSNLIFADKNFSKSIIDISPISSFKNRRSSNYLYISQVKTIKDDYDLTRKKIFKNSKKVLLQNKKQAPEPQLPQEAVSIPI